MKKPTNSLKKQIEKHKFTDKNLAEMLKKIDPKYVSSIPSVGHAKA